jgi:hypothetical protein
MKFAIVGAVVLLMVTRTARWRSRLSTKPLIAKIAAIVLAVGWVAAVFAVLFII